MNREMNYKESSMEILRILAGLLKSLGLQKGAYYAVFAMLPQPLQQLSLADWIVEELEKGETLTQEIIMEKVESMREE